MAKLIPTLNCHVEVLPMKLSKRSRSCKNCTLKVCRGMRWGFSIEWNLWVKQFTLNFKRRTYRSNGWIGKEYNLQRDRDLKDIVYDVLKVNPELTERIKISGGLEWLQRCFHESVNSEFSGLGQGSKLIQAILSGYKLSS